MTFIVLIHLSIYCNTYKSFPLKLFQPIEPPSPARMMLLLLPLLLFLDLGLTQALVKPGREQPNVSKKIVLENQDLTYNSLTDENKAMTLSYPLPPALFRGRKPDTGEPSSHFNESPI